MKDQSIFDNYELTWKEILEKPDGSIDKEQLMKELYDFSKLISNLSKIYCYISGNRASYPTIHPETVLQLFEEELKEQYDRGYQDALDDMGDENGEPTRNN